MDFEESTFCGFFLKSPLVFSLAIDFPTQQSLTFSNILISHPKKKCTKENGIPNNPIKNSSNVPSLPIGFPIPFRAPTQVGTLSHPNESHLHFTPH
jgi:hypothetical protein